MTFRWRTLLPLAALLLARLVTACSCGTPAGPCETAADCNGDQVCDPASSTCQTLGCTGDSDCGVGAECVSSSCVNLVVDGGGGGPEGCTEDADCGANEACVGGTCREQRPADSPCTTAEDCAGQLVCDPSNDRCAEDVGCTEHADCGIAAYCDGAGAGSGQCVPNEEQGPCEEDSQCVDGERCVGIVCIPEQCEGSAFSAEPVPANVMITIDRSGSMNNNIGNDGSKWDVGRAAIEQLLATASTAINFGLNPYPGFSQNCNQGQQCGPGALALDLGSDRQEIVDYLNDADTCSFGTPTAENLEMLVGLESLQNPERNNFVLLITDGQSTCDNPVPVVEDLFDQSPPVRTFVVGFGNGVDEDELADMAEAGGTARNGNPVYYQADDAASLEAAFAEIAGSVLGCEYTIDATPDEDPALMGVFFNGNLVPRDPSGQTGWDVNLNAGRITFAGNACVALQTGLVTDLTIVYGCPQIVEPDPEEDAGVPPEDDGGVIVPPDGCTRCGSECVGQACLIPPGETVGMCGACEDDGDCCPGSLCLPSGACINIGG